MDKGRDFFVRQNQNLVLNAFEKILSPKIRVAKSIFILEFLENMSESKIGVAKSKFVLGIL